MFFKKLFNKDIIDDYYVFIENIGKKKINYSKFNWVHEKNNLERSINIIKKYVVNEFPIINDLNPLYNIELSNDIGVVEFKIPKNQKIYSNKLSKQRIINAFVQGAAYSMNRVYHIIEEFSEEEKNVYESYFNLVEFNLYDSDPYSVLRNKSGTSFVDFRGDKPIFNIEASNIVLGIHETVKSIYTLLSLHAYDDVDEYKKITKLTDTLYNEIDDIRFGNYLYVKTKEYLIENYDSYFTTGNNFFEMFFINLIKTNSTEFLLLIKSILENKKNHDIEMICRDSLKIVNKYEAEKFID